MENPTPIIRVTGVNSTAEAPSISRMLARVQVRSVAVLKDPPRTGGSDTAGGNVARGGMVDVLELRLIP